MRKRNIAVFCIDYDGCGQFMFKSDVERNQSINSENSIIKSIYEIAEQDADKIIITVGSSRQDLRTDLLGARVNENGACFASYEMLTAHLNEVLDVDVEFSPILTADIWNNLPIGSAVRDISLVAKWDEFKPTIVLAQAHYFSEQHHSDNVFFFFIDDRSGVGIRGITYKLCKLFGDLRYILPYNVFFSALNYNPYQHTISRPPEYTDYITSLGPILPRNSWIKFVKNIIRIHEDLDDISRYFDNFQEKKKALQSYNAHFEKFKELDLTNSEDTVCELNVLTRSVADAINQGLFKLTDADRATERTRLLSRRMSSSSN